MPEIIFLDHNNISKVDDFNYGVRFAKILEATPRSLLARRNGLLHTRGMMRSADYFSKVVLGRGLKNRPSKRSLIGVETIEGSLDADSLLGLVTVSWIHGKYSATKRDELKFAVDGYSIDGFSSSDDPAESVHGLYAAALEELHQAEPDSTAFAFEPVVGSTVGLLRKAPQTDITARLHNVFMAGPITDGPVRVVRTAEGVETISRAQILSSALPIDIVH